VRILTSRERCEGHGLCAALAPEVFDLDDEAVVVNRFDDREVPAEHAEAARRGVQACPVAALRIAD
jgi:Ferredoxin